MEPFLRENKEICKSSVAQLLKIFDNPQDAQDLRLELAAIIDAGVHFVSATYFLEGDGPLLFSCYERLSAVSRAVAVAHYPNTAAVAHKIADGDHARYQQLMAQAKACIQPGLTSSNRSSVYNSIIQCALSWLPGSVVQDRYNI